MLPEKIELEIVTAERRVISETVDEVILPGREGYLGVRPGHTPLLTGLTVGEISYRAGEEWHHVAASGGFVEVLGDRVSVLADTAERGEEIDLGRAEKARKRAEAELAAASSNDYQQTASKLQKANTRIQVHGKRGRA